MEINRPLDYRDKTIWGMDDLYYEVAKHARRARLAQEELNRRTLEADNGFWGANMKDFIFEAMDRGPWKRIVYVDVNKNS